MNASTPASTARPAPDAADDIAARSIAATRIFNAPRTLVFKVWTDPNHIANWWGPIGFRTTIHEMVVRPGGRWRFVMHGPDGVDYDNEILYREVVEPERLVYDHLGGPDFHVTVTFEELDGKTKLSMEMLFQTAKARTAVAEKYGAVEGLQQTLSRFEEFLTRTEQSAPPAPIVVSRLVNAPSDLVFRAWTDPALLAQWWGPKGSSTPVCTVDLRPGGKLHYCMRLPDGPDIWGMGYYREIVPNERLVFLDCFSDPQGNPVLPARYGMSPDHAVETLVTVTFAAQGEKTLVTIHFPVPAPFAEHDKIGQGWKEMLDRLEGIL